MTRAALGVLVLSATAVGGTAGYTLRAAERDRALAATLAAHSAEVHALREALPANPPETLRREDVVAMVQAATAPRTASNPPAVVPAEPPAPSPAARATVESARRLVDDAVADGRWTNERRSDLRTLLRRADAETRDEALRYLSRAANRNALTLDTDGPPL